MRELAAGNEAALGKLLGRYQRPLSSFIHRHTGGRDVEDLTQETWLRVVRAAERFDPNKRFSTWLFQIAVNLCRDWHRRPPPEPSELRREPGRIDRTSAKLDAARLLEQLSPAQREVVVLRYYHDLPEGEVSEILGCPRGTVKSRLHNAIVRLSELVRGEEEAGS